MKCPNDSTNMFFFPETLDIFGPGTFLLYCPYCCHVAEGVDEGVPQEEKELREAYTPEVRSEIIFLEMKKLKQIRKES